MDGKMIDVASAERCRRTLDRADAIADMNRRKKRLLETPTPWRKDSEQLLQIPRSAEKKGCNCYPEDGLQGGITQGLFSPLRYALRGVLYGNSAAGPPV